MPKLILTKGTVKDSILLNNSHSSTLHKQQPSTTQLECI